MKTFQIIANYDGQVIKPCADVLILIKPVKYDDNNDYKKVFIIDEKNITNRTLSLKKNPCIIICSLLCDRDYIHKQIKKANGKKTIILITGEYLPDYASSLKDIVALWSYAGDSRYLNMTSPVQLSNPAQEYNDTYINIQ